MTENAASPRAPISRMAFASLVLGIVGPLTLGMAGAVGLVLGAVALVKAGKEAGRRRERRTALAGILVSAVGMILVPILVAAIIAIPAIERSREAARVKAGPANVTQMCFAAQTYALNHDDRLPPADAWPDALSRFGVPDAALCHPSQPDAGRAYAINAQVAGKARDAIARPSETVLFFECAPGSPLAGGPADLPPEPRHRRGYLIGFCDGHAQYVTQEDLGRLNWEPE